MYELWYSGTEGRWCRQLLAESEGLGFEPLIETAEKEIGRYGDATIIFVGSLSDVGLSLWSVRAGMRWSDTGADRWV